MDETLYVKADLLDSFESLNVVFTLFTSVLSMIALFIAFFLLLISMTQNVNEAIWEYGVLRSMGVTKEQGHRIYQYEAFMITITAASLGILVGMATAVLLTVQFYMFLQLKVDFNFPWLMLSGMLVVSFLTTFIAVCLPMKRVNQRNIATTLKGGS